MSCLQVVRKGGMRASAWEKLYHSCFLRQEMVCCFQNMRKRRRYTGSCLIAGEGSEAECNNCHYTGCCVTSARAPGLSDQRFPAAKWKRQTWQDHEVYLAVDAIVPYFLYVLVWVIASEEFVKIKFAFPICTVCRCYWGWWGNDCRKAEGEERAERSLFFESFEDVCACLCAVQNFAFVLGPWQPGLIHESHRNFLMTLTYLNDDGGTRTDFGCPSSLLGFSTTLFFGFYPPSFHMIKAQSQNVEFKSATGLSSLPVGDGEVGRELWSPGFSHFVMVGLNNDTMESKAKGVWVQKVGKHLEMMSASLLSIF